MSVIDLQGVRVLEIPSSFYSIAIAGSELAAVRAAVTTIDGGRQTAARDAVLAVGKHAIPAPPDMVELARTFDVVLMGEDGGRELARELARDTVVGLVSGWGATGPMAGRPADEVTVQAAAAYLQYLGKPSYPPRRMGADIASFATSVLLLEGVFALMSAGRRTDLVEVSMFGSLCMAKALMWASFSDPANVQFGRTLMGPDRSPQLGYRTKDGLVTLDFRPATEQQWRAFIGSLGIEKRFNRLAEPNDWRRTVGTGDLVGDYRDAYEKGLASRSTAETMELAQAHGGMCVPYQDYRRVTAHQQVKAVHGLESVPVKGRRLTRVRPLLDDGSTGPTRHSQVPPASAPKVTATPASAPLKGVRVLDFTAAAAGPFAGFVLARLGADVVKIEPPGGDFLVGLSPAPATHCGYAALNGGKRVVRMDLRDAANRAAVQQLAESADVVIENFRSGVMERLGLSFESLAAANPKLVFLSMRGYGDDGPLAADRCTDPQMQAFSGLANLNAGPHGPEIFRYAAVIDMCSGMSGAMLVLAALAARRLAPAPRHVTTSMLRVALALQAGALADELSGDTASASPGVVVDCSDGRVVIANAPGTAALLSKDGLTLPRPRRKSGWELEAGSSQQAVEWWRGRGGEAGVAVAPWLTDRQVMDSAIALEPGWLEEVQTTWGSVLTLSTTPWRFLDGAPPASVAPPSAAEFDADLAKRILSRLGWPEPDPI